MAFCRTLPLVPLLIGSLALSSPLFAQPSEAPPSVEPTVPATPSPGTGAASPLALLRQLDAGFVEVFKKVAPSVVVIDTTKTASTASNDSFDFYFRSPDDDTPRPFRMPERDNRSEGSGFIIREDGYILTNNHVIEGAQKITVKLKDGRRMEGKVIGTDERTDIAIIKIEEKGLPIATLGDSDALQIGQIVCAIGVPFALEYSFTIGCVSGKGRANLSSHVTYEDYIQTDAVINPGNSGGPLFDVEGHVVGMNTLINGVGRGLAFAIPSNMLQQVSEELIATGKVRRPWLGIRIETLEPESSLREQIKGIERGVVINTIEPEAPAYKSDLRPADVITAVDGRPVATAPDLQKEILRKKVGDSVMLSIWRDGKTLQLPVTTGELPGPGSTASGQPQPSDPAQPPGADESEETPYGLTFEDITPERAQSLGIAPEDGGVIVKGVTPGSPAEVAQLQEGDVITEAASQPVRNAESFRKLLDSHDHQKPLLLLLDRKGQKTYAVLKAEPS